MEHEVDVEMRSLEDSATDSVGWEEFGDYSTHKVIGYTYHVFDNTMY